MSDNTRYIISPPPPPTPTLFRWFDNNFLWNVPAGKSRFHQMAANVKGTCHIRLVSPFRFTNFHTREKKLRLGSGGAILVFLMVPQALACSAKPMFMGVQLVSFIRDRTKGRGSGGIFWEFPN